MTAELETLLAQNPVFGRLSPDQRLAAAQSAQRRRYARGVYLAFAGDVWPYLFIVKNGQIDGVKESGEGRQLVVQSLKPGSVFWGLAFFRDGAPMPVSLAAQAESEVFLWSREHLLPVLRAQPDALWALCQAMISYMQQASRVVEGLAFQPVAGRLATFLLAQFADYGEPAMTRNLTLDQIAAQVGTTREQACRALYQFSDQNLISITRTELELLDEAGLAEIARQT